MSVGIPVGNIVVIVNMPGLSAINIITLFELFSKGMSAVIKVIEYCLLQARFLGFNSRPGQVNMV